MPVTEQDLTTHLPEVFNATTLVKYMLQHQQPFLIALFQGDNRYLMSRLIREFTHSPFSHVGIVRLNDDNQAELCESIEQGGVRCIDLKRIWTGYGSPGSGPYGGLAAFAPFPDTLNASKVDAVIDYTLQIKTTYALGHDIEIGLREVFYDTFCKKWFPNCNRHWSDIDINVKKMQCAENVKYVWDASNPNNIPMDTITKSYLPASFAEQPNINGIFRANLSSDSLVSVKNLRAMAPNRHLCLYATNNEITPRCQPMTTAQHQLSATELQFPHCLTNPSNHSQQICVNTFDQPIDQFDTPHSPAPAPTSANHHTLVNTLLATGGAIAFLLLMMVGIRCFKKHRRQHRPALDIGHGRNYKTIGS